MVSLIGLHITKAPHWPVKIPPHPQTTIKFHTCNRCQILTEKDDVDKVLKLFEGYSPEVWEDRECVRKLFSIANGSDSIAKGHPAIRKQMIQSRISYGTPKLKRLVSDVVNITDRIYPPEPVKYIDSCKQFLQQLGFFNVKVITSENQHDPSMYQCDAAILYAYTPMKVDNHFKFYMNVSAYEYPIDPIYLDLVPLMRWARVQPIADTRPIADLYYDKMYMSDWKRNISSALLTHGLSTREIEYLFNVSNI